MAYPVIDLPMYEPLKKISDELFLPEPQPHPAEQHHAAGDEPEVHRGVHGRPQPRVRPRAAVARVPDRPARQRLPAVLGRPGRLRRRRPRRRGAARRSCATSRELHAGRRRRSSATTTTASSAGDDEEEVVLVIRGELLKRYPNAVIYAQKARWQTEATATSIPAQERTLGRAHRGGGDEAAARQAADAAVRGEGRSRHHVLRLRPHRRTRRAGTAAKSRRPARAGSS